MQISPEKKQEMQEDEKIQHLAGYLVNDFIDGKESYNHLLQKADFDVDLAEKVLKQSKTILNGKKIAKIIFDKEYEDFNQKITDWIKRLEKLKQQAR
jgi:hypothetical protein